MSKAFAGKVAIVTGGAGGLGAATARVLAADGCAVALWDISLTAVQALADELATSGAMGLAQQVDILSAKAIDAAVTTVRSTLGRVDYLVNSAGVDHTLPITELTVEQWDHVLGVNLRGAFLTTRAVFPIMRDQNGGHIVNVASTAAVRAWPNASAYVASKWGLIGFTRAIGTEGRPYLIRATSVIPGGMRTGFFDRPDLPIKPDPTNLNDPINVARTIAFVLSQPPESVVQEIMVVPLTETSWP